MIWKLLLVQLRYFSNKYSQHTIKNLYVGFLFITQDKVVLKKKKKIETVSACQTLC